MDSSMLRATARYWLRLGRPGVLIEVMQVRGSVPRDAGTLMLVGSDVLVGTIGGGHLELRAVTEARAAKRE